MTNQFSFINTSKYVSGQATKIFVSYPFYKNDEVPLFELELAFPVLVGDQILRLKNPSTIKIYEWTRLQSQHILNNPQKNNNSFFVSSDIPAGAMEISIYPSNIDLGTGEKIYISGRTPLFSAKSVTVDQQSTINVENNFSDLNVKRAITGVTASGSIEGALVFGDQGNTIIQQAIKKGQMVQVEVIDSDRKRADIMRCFLSANKQSQVQQFKSMSYSWFADKVSTITFPESIRNLRTNIINGGYPDSIFNRVIDGGTSTKTTIDQRYDGGELAVSI